MLTSGVVLVATMITLFSQIEVSSSAHLIASGDKLPKQNTNQRVYRAQPRRIKISRDLVSSQSHLRARDLDPIASMNFKQNQTESTRSPISGVHHIGANNQTSPKRFKSSFRGSATQNDLNNNSPSSSHLANTASNEIQVDSEEITNQPRNWRRNVSSINGTIDVTEYQQNDLDRLYGDALLVYFKNFNE